MADRTHAVASDHEQARVGGPRHEHFLRVTRFDFPRHLWLSNQTGDGLLQHARLDAFRVLGADGTV